MSKLNKAVAVLAKRDIAFRGMLLTAMGKTPKHTPSRLRTMMASGIKIGFAAQDVMDAFADTNYTPSEGFAKFNYDDPAMGEAMQKRKMKFRSRNWLRLKPWTVIMSSAIPDSYNEFVAKKVGRWLLNIERKVGAGPLEIQPAREYSVAAYVRGPRETLEAIIKSGKRRGGRTDEAWWERGKEGEVVRLWWD